jgi:predicted O-methyltransferase YrrM
MMQSYLDTLSKTDKRRFAFRLMLDALLNAIGHKGKAMYVETGCVRSRDDFGAGYSTVLFDQFIDQYPQAQGYSVDNDAQHVKFAEGLVKHVKLINMDSVYWLAAVSNPAVDLTVDALYLDSYDLNRAAPHNAALHGMKELAAAAPLLRPGSIVAVDDNFSPECGKGMYVREFMRNAGKALIVPEDSYTLVWRW